jgi:hypothetical protein
MVAMSYVSAFAGLLVILLVHFYASWILGKHRFQKLLLDIIAGITIAYAFIDLFPHLARKQSSLESIPLGPFAIYLTHHVYLMALLGFSVFVGIRAFNAEEVDRKNSHIAYIMVVASMCLYALLIGYMLAEQPVYRPETALLFGIAMGAHFLGLDHSLSHERRAAYDKTVRYLLIGCTTTGFLGGFFYTISPPVYALVFAYIAGGIVAVGAITDLPRVKSSREFTGFMAGVIVYSGILLLLEALRQ